MKLITSFSNWRLLKKGRVFYSLFFILIICNLYGQKELISILKFKSNIELKNVSNNPYKLFTDYQFGKTKKTIFLANLDKENYFVDFLGSDKTKRYFINKDSLYKVLKKNEIQTLKFYGFSKYEILNEKLFAECDGKLYEFYFDGVSYLFKTKYVIPDTLDFTDFKFVNDSSILFIHYPVRYSQNSHYKVYLFLLKENKLMELYSSPLSCSAVNYFSGGYCRYDFQNDKLIISDNIKYDIKIIDLKGKIISYSKNLNINDFKIQELNSIKKNKGSYDTLKRIFQSIPRILNVQFLNDSSIIVNYSTKSNIDTLDVSIKDSRIDLLKLKNDTITYLNTFTDEFIYLSSTNPKTLSQGSINPFLQSSGSFLFLNNSLYILQTNNMIPSKKCKDLASYIRKSKKLIFSLKGIPIISVYDFTKL